MGYWRGKWDGGVHTARGARASAFSLHDDGVDELIDCGGFGVVLI